MKSNYTFSYVELILDLIIPSVVMNRYKVEITYTISFRGLPTSVTREVLCANSLLAVAEVTVDIARDECYSSESEAYCGVNDIIAVTVTEVD